MTSHIKVNDIWKDISLPEKEFLCKTLKLSLVQFAFTDLQQLEEAFAQAPCNVHKWNYETYLALKLEGLLIDQGGWPISPSEQAKERLRARQSTVATERVEGTPGV